jgi:transcriptional regulator with XRE-family HTH domain
MDTPFRRIRLWLDMSQQALAAALDIAQTNVSAYETGKHAVPSSIAARLIDIAKSRGLVIDFNHVYRDDVGLPAKPEPVKPPAPVKVKRRRGRPRKKPLPQPEPSPVVVPAVPRGPRRRVVYSGR